MADFELPGYEVYERVGRGGMASVYRALHLNLDREIAVKVMDPAMNSDENFSERFIREARISARLTHPHILQIYDVNSFDGLNYIAMEYLSAGDLDDLIQKAMQQSIIYQVMQQMTDALDYASGRGYVHRDIKPSNIMLRSRGDFVLTDFGIARAANSGTQMTQTGLMVGTPSYMSPEQAKGEEVDGRSDLYAMAILGYEMLTKTLPYQSESAVTTAVKHLTEDIPTLSGELVAYQAFFNKAMAKKADDRFQTGHEMYAAFVEAGRDFANDAVLTPALEPESRSESQLASQSGSTPGRAASGGGADTTPIPTAFLSDVTQVTRGSSAAGSRPYRLEGTEQRERLVSGMHQRQRRASAGALAVRVIVAAVVVGSLGYFGYGYWQKQQGDFSNNLRVITTEIGAAYSAIDKDDLSAAAKSFNKVLKIDGQNAAANEGIEKIGALYSSSIEQALNKEDADAAGMLIEEYALNISNGANLAAYRSQLTQLRDGQRIEAQQQADLIATEKAQAQAVEEQQAFIEERLLQATELAAQFPEDPSLAFELLGLYQEVLAVDAENVPANSGISELLDYYLDGAEAAAATGDFAMAGEILASADELIPGQEAVTGAQEELPALEQAWQDKQAVEKQQAAVAAAAREKKQAEAAAAQEVAAVAEQQAIEVAQGGIEALQSGEAATAQQAYDDVATTHPSLGVVTQLRTELQGTYLRSAQEQLAAKDYDGAMSWVALGRKVAPGDVDWDELESQIESSRTGGRRRLGTY
ncbi:MAG: serine/threonine-protein kinase [Halioglobus sp.]